MKRMCDTSNKRNDNVRRRQDIQTKDASNGGRDN